MNALSFECRKVALKQDRTGFILTLSMHPDEIPEELLRDFVGARYMCALAKVDDNELPVNYSNRVKTAGMICRLPLFQKWLRQENSLTVHSEDDAVDALYNICGIKSRTELNGNINAQQQFDEMINDYDQWKEESKPF